MGISSISIWMNMCVMRNRKLPKPTLTLRPMRLILELLLALKRWQNWQTYTPLWIDITSGLESCGRLAMNWQRKSSLSPGQISRSNTSRCLFGRGKRLPIFTSCLTVHQQFITDQRYTVIYCRPLTLTCRSKNKSNCYVRSMTCLLYTSDAADEEDSV